MQGKLLPTLGTQAPHPDQGLWYSVPDPQPSPRVEGDEPKEEVTLSTVHLSKRDLVLPGASGSPLPLVLAPAATTTTQQSPGEVGLHSSPGSVPSRPVGTGENS